MELTQPQNGAQPNDASASAANPVPSTPQPPNSQPAPAPINQSPPPVQPLDRSTLPPELKGFNWGALLLSWIWGIGNKVWLSLLALIPGANLVMAIVLGFMGNEWAWRAGQWDSIEQFKSVQRKWKIGGFIYLLAIFLLILLFAALGIFHGSASVTTY